MAANVDAILREGIAAFKSGRKEDARAFLLRAVELDQYNEQAWLWLSAVVDTTEDQRTCLENVLAINPENERARTGLDSLSNAPAPARPAARPNEFPTSVEWAEAAPAQDSFSDPAPITPEISDDDYDDWVANLNLPSASAPASTPANDAFASNDPFGGAFFGDDPDTDANDDSLSDSFASSSPFSTLGFETVFGSPEAAAAIPPPPPPPPPSGSKSPVMRSPGPEAVTFDDIDLRSTGVFAQFEDEDDFAESNLEELNAEELFQYIPADIEATRLPGTRERYPVMLMLGLVLLVLLNAGALFLLVYRLL